MIGEWKKQPSIYQAKRILCVKTLLPETKLCVRLSDTGPKTLCTRRRLVQPKAIIRQGLSGHGKNLILILKTMKWY